MLFSSISFLYYFLPIVLLAYVIAPKACKNGVLLCASLLFYAWGEPRYVLLMLTVIVAGYCSGLFLMRCSKERYRKWILGISVLFDFGVLAYFKYADFFIENWNRAMGMSVPMLRIALPIGISFYIFQIISYLIDVYRKEAMPQKNIIRLALYISMFPQLIAGPIVRYQLIEKQLDDRMHSVEQFSLGMRRFVLGLGKKVLIANTLGELCDIAKQSQDLSVAYLWLSAIAFALHIYYDFSGYSDMAIGLGNIFGFHFPENFNYPYISRSITEFWRRWHMTLGTWFRDYVYIPLGGNRVKKARWLFNVAVVWMITGFWHGASWNFVAWGLYFAVLLMIEKLWLLNYLEKKRWIGHVYALFFVVIGFVIFNADSMTEVVSSMRGLFGFGGIELVSEEFWYYLKSYCIVFIISMIGATPGPGLCVQKIGQMPKGKQILYVLEPIGLVLILAVVTGYLVDGSFNPFLYFRF